VYHRMLGVDHFFIYDDHPAYPMEAFLKPHREYVTVVPGLARMRFCRGGQPRQRPMCMRWCGLCYQFSW
jgi:hypothetical protein